VSGDGDSTIYRLRESDGRNRHVRYRVVDVAKNRFGYPILLIRRADSGRARPVTEWVNEGWFLSTLEPEPQSEGTK
jgi:hypothetical protein